MTESSDRPTEIEQEDGDGEFRIMNLVPRKRGIEISVRALFGGNLYCILCKKSDILKRCDEKTLFCFMSRRV
jgi:hypothetical protein